MEEKNLYQAPKADLMVEADRTERTAGYLRAALMFAFGVYAFCAVLFSLFGLIFVLQDAALKSMVNLVNLAIIAALVIKAFLAVRRKQAKVARWALLLFVFGFVTTTAYRLVFVDSAPDHTELSNFLIFGIPAVCAHWYAKLIGAERGQP